MKTPFLLVSLLIGITLSAQGPWTQKSSLPSNGRHRCVTFSVGDRGYMGCGWNGVTMYQDFWEYDPGSDTWMQKQDYPAGPRLSAFGFSIGNKGYAGCGLDQNLYAQPDFWSYDPSTNTWSSRASFIGTPMFGASTAVINNKGYVIFGDDWDPNYWRHGEMYCYNPVSNSWAYETVCPADGRRDAVGFALNNKFYLGTGNDNSYMEDSDWWSYDPSNAQWTACAPFPGTARSQAVGWAIGSKGYMGTGGLADVNDFWEYDANTNSWQQVNDFPGQGRENAQSFVINNKGYLVCGTSGVNYADIWEFDPLHIVGIDEMDETALQVDLYPNPATDLINIRLTDANDTRMTYQILDISGRITKEGNLEAVSGVMQVPVNELACGNYTLKLVAASRSCAVKFNKQ